MEDEEEVGTLRFLAVVEDDVMLVLALGFLGGLELWIAVLFLEVPLLRDDG